MRVAKDDGVFAGALLVVALALVLLSAPLTAHAREMCTTITADMQAGYHALERGQYEDADNSFKVAGNKYVFCLMPGLNFTPDDERGSVYWLGYAFAGNAAANFGAGKITEGLEGTKKAEGYFQVLVDGKGSGEGASDSERRAASDGIAFARSLASTKKPLLPKVWLDWKAAHP